ncbi:ATP-binding cassette domain-containing protein [Ornithinicoccus hortensis]|uniref:ABC-2 type transport system ATP-binding protein n=1 Tax=Ornithinicoccus hortensis TaxID=82346 RepID=A0A542YUE5_9MICO|nr:ATP-binding cassette domain-containing protein [Ornithinicoccus hortensis]TQL51703.1 ABC-2 type transport system ATP-binding protein [Ornithinicoccus hortensis]
MSYTDNPVIELEGVTKQYGATPVLTGIDLTLAPGVHALLGPNGAGKTTLVNILTTLVPPDSGTVCILGMDTRTRGADIRRRISVTGQFAAVDDVLTGQENLVMMGRLLGLPASRARVRARELLDRFDLAAAAGRRVATYSGGMRRRLDLAVSLIWPPEVLFLDEPTTGLDTRSRLVLWQQIRELAGEGTTVFLTTQYLEEADQLAQQIAVLDQGLIVAQGSASHLKGLVGREVVRVLDADGAAVREVPTDGSAGDLARISAEAAAQLPGARVEVHRPTLDDAFLKLTGRRTVPDDDGAADRGHELAGAGVAR